MQRFTRPFRALGIALGIVLAAGVAQAQDFPNKQIRVVLPLAAGQSADQIMRALAVPMSREAKVPVVIDNKPGASAFIAVQALTAAPPDGYTVLIGSGQTHGQNSALFKKIPYDPIRDFTPVIFLNRGGFAFVVAADSPIKTAEDLLAAARRKPGGLSVGTASTGTQLSGVLLEQMAKVKVNNIPYKGAPQAITDLLGGQLDFVIADLPSAQGLVQQGRLRALAVTSLERHPVLRNVPTWNESGLPGYEMIAWAGVFAPANTPAPVVAKLNALFHHALASPEGQAFYAQVGLKPEPGTPEDLGRHVRAQLEKWSTLVTAAGIQPE